MDEKGIRRLIEGERAPTFARRDLDPEDAAYFLSFAPAVPAVMPAGIGARTWWSAVLFLGPGRRGNDAMLPWRDRHSSVGRPLLATSCDVPSLGWAIVLVCAYSRRMKRCMDG